MMMRRWVPLLGTLLAICLCGCGGDGSSKPTIAAAASLRRVLPALIEAYGEDTFNVAYAGSGTLRQQIEAGADIDLTILASDRHIDLLIERGLATAASRTVLARNVLVLVGPSDSPALAFETLATLPPDARLAIGNPDSVPAGHYAREALRALGSWRGLKRRCVYAQNVGGVLTFVRRGEVTAGIAYVTDIQSLEGVKELDRAKGAWAPRPVVVAALVSEASHGEQARRFLDFLGSAKARSIFEEFGFRAP